jgi:hypothetical protein
MDPLLLNPGRSKLEKTYYTTTMAFIDRKVCQKKATQKPFFGLKM